VEESSRLKRLQHKVAQRFLLRHLSSAFHGWYVVGLGRLGLYCFVLVWRFVFTYIFYFFQKFPKKMIPNWYRYNNVHAILHNRAILHKFSMRMKNSHLISSFRAWHHHIESIIRNRSIIKRFGARFNNQALSKCFNKWHHDAGESSRLKRLQHKVAQRFLLRHLSSAFHGWYVLGGGLGCLFFLFFLFYYLYVSVSYLYVH
jgi:hypothetical protein